MLIKEDTESCWKVGLDRRGVTFLIINFNGKFLSLGMKKEKKEKEVKKERMDLSRDRLSVLLEFSR